MYGMGKNITKVAPLTSARFIAALYVVVFHTVYASGYKLSPWFKSFVNLGETSVSFFFVLSGYILGIVYLRTGNPVNKKRFWLARFARIYPLFFLTLMWDAPHCLFERMAKYGWHKAVTETFITFIANGLMLHGWFRIFAGINNPSWSLSAEAFFYLLFPMIGTAIWKLRRRLAVFFAIGLYLGSVTIILALSHRGFGENVWYYMPIFRLSEFIVGILVAKFHTAALSNDRSKLILRNAAIPVLIGSIMCFCLISLSQGAFSKALLQTVLFVPIHAAIVVSLASDPPYLNRFLSLPILVLLGEASYGLYLIHIPLWHVFQSCNLLGRPLCYLAFILLAVLLSVCSFLYFESPSRMRILKFFSERDSEGVVSSSLAQ